LGEDALGLGEHEVTGPSVVDVRDATEEEGRVSDEFSAHMVREVTKRGGES
jgi:hypothetical protein